MNKKMRGIVGALLFCLYYINLCADDITVVNHTDGPVWVGVYRLKENLLGNSVGDATLQNKIVKILSDEKIKLDRSKLIIKTNRELFFSETESGLKEKFSAVEYKLVAKTPVSMKHGSTFHIAEKNNVLHGYSDIEWKVVEPVVSAARKIFDRMIQDIRNDVSKHRYGKEVAYIRRGSDLANEEINFLTKRTQKIKPKLEKLLGISLNENEVPRIAVCLSGGGMRAATAAQGLIDGLNSIGLLDVTTYVAGLSGGTWTLSSFVELGLPIEKYSEVFLNAASKLNFFCPADVAHVLWPKYIFNQQTSLVDLYGVFLANTFFNNIDANKFARQEIRLSDSQRRVVNGDCFFPIYTAVQVKGSDVHSDVHWATFTPYEFGIDDFNMNIPIWALGRKFKAGKSSDFAPELTLGFLMGVWGSAGSGSLNNMLDTQKNKLPRTLLKAISDVFVETHIGVARMAAIRVFNPQYGISDASTKNLKQLTLMDGGYDFIFPLPPLLKKERKVDIIIFMDASGSVFEDTPEFKKTISFAEARSFPLPKIDYESLLKNQVNVFADKDNVAAPTLIYLAPVQNKNYDASFDSKKEYAVTYPTTKFTYDKKDVVKFSGLIKQNVIDNKMQFLDAIRKKIEQKRKK